MLRSLGVLNLIPILALVGEPIPPCDNFRPPQAIVSTRFLRHLIFSLVHNLYQPQFFDHAPKLPVGTEHLPQAKPCLPLSTVR